jgi:flagellar motor switch protein FliN/FliY
MAEPGGTHETQLAAGIVEEFSELFDVPMRVVLEVGRRTMKVREILLLKPDSLVEITKSAGENLDLYINDRLVAFGEVLEMDGRAGIRLTDFIGQS